MPSLTSSSESVPILEKGRQKIDVWERRFNDYCIEKKWSRLITGAEERPLVLTHAELQAIPAASRYTASKDRAREIEDYDDRCEAAFAGLCKAMQEDAMIYASAELDALRAAAHHNPAATYTFIMANLRPTHVDAQMTAEAKIQCFGLLKDETVPAAHQRLMALVNCLDPDSRPDDNTLMRHMKRAIKGNAAATKLYMAKVESMMDREPLVTFAEFCKGLMRKYEESVAEAAQEAALNTEHSQASYHHDNENEQAMYSYNKGGGNNKGGRGKGRGSRGRMMGKGQTDSRIGALYYGKGGYTEGSEYGSHDNQPFYRGGFRHNGGRGYGFGKGKSSTHSNDYYGNNKRARDSDVNAGGKGSKPKFEGVCHRCNHYGHRASDCYSKKTKA